MSRIAVDFDGTLVEKAWPGMGDWFKDAEWAMRTLREAGHHPYLYSARLSPQWPDGTPRSPVDMVIEIEKVRAKLDGAGLAWLPIWEGDGKPHWDLLVDDKAMWFPGRQGSWRKIMPAILKRVGDEDTFEAVMAEASKEDE